MEVKIIGLITIVVFWIILRLMNHKVFMYQRTIRKIEDKGRDKSCLYPSKYLKLYRFSMIRYVLLIPIFIINIWVGIACLIFSFILTNLTPEQDDYTNLHRALSALSERRDYNMSEYANISLYALCILNIFKDFDKTRLSIKTLFPLYEDITLKEIIDLLSDDSRQFEIEHYTNIGDLGINLEYPIIQNWRTAVIKCIGMTKSYNVLSFHEIKQKLYTEWESKYKATITDYEAAIIVRQTIAGGVTNWKRILNSKKYKPTQISLLNYISFNELLGIKLGDKIEDCKNYLCKLELKYEEIACLGYNNTPTDFAYMYTEYFNWCGCRTRLRIDFNKGENIVSRCVLMFQTDEDRFESDYESLFDALTKVFGNPTKNRRFKDELFEFNYMLFVSTEWHNSPDYKIALRREFIGGKDMFLGISVCFLNYKSFKESNEKKSQVVKRLIHTNPLLYK